MAAVRLRGIAGRSEAPYTVDVDLEGLSQYGTAKVGLIPGGKLQSLETHAQRAGHFWRTRLPVAT